ncbi:CorA metal ion transporter, partial [Tulasnella sp. 403]
MSSPHRRSPSGSPRTVRIDPNVDLTHRPLVRSPSETSQHGPRLSPTLTRGFDTSDVDARERQREMDVDSAMQLSRARSGSVGQIQSPHDALHQDSNGGVARRHGSNGETTFPMLSLSEQEEMLIARGDYAPATHDVDAPYVPEAEGHPEHHGLDLEDELGPDAIDVNIGLVRNMNMGIPDPLPALQADQAQDMGMGGLPMYQPAIYRSTFDFHAMEQFATQEKETLGLSTLPSPAQGPLASTSTGAELRRRLAQAATANGLGAPSAVSAQEDSEGAMTGILSPNGATSATDSGGQTPSATPSFARRRQRKLSQSNSAPRRQGKLALFEGNTGPPPSSLMPSTSHHISFANGPYPTAQKSQPPFAVSSSLNIPDAAGPSSQSGGIFTHSGHDRPYRFSFYSYAQSHTIHARSLSELPAEGQTFEELFTGRQPQETRSSSRLSKNPVGLGTMNGTATPDMGTLPNLKIPSNDFKSPNGLVDRGGGPGGPDASRTSLDADINTWWLDVTCPTDEEMRMLSKVFGIHPLTTEDILMEETREKIELFRNYYFVCFRSFDQDIYSPTHLEPLNMYIIVFREGTLSFHFRGTPHPQNVRRRIKQLKDYINVTSDWISYALIDDITDAFGPLIQSIEYEVDSIDELVLILKDTEQSDMLRRIGTCRKKVMGLLRLMGNKADVVKGLAKRCNENWSVAPKSDIGLYLSDIQDHLITMTQNLNHYEKILSRSHSNYLAQISIEMTDANNQINDVLSKLTALGTVLIPMNLVTGLWGMNVHVPGQDIETGYSWFLS